MKIEEINLNSIKANPSNPRTIRDEKFEKLVQSIKDFPEMLKIRPLVVNDDMIVLGGNMRLKACKEAGLKKIPVIKASELTSEQQKEFIIKDNVGYGDWDWSLIATEFPEAEAWGLDVPNFLNQEDIDLDKFFEDNGDSEKEQKFKIILEYTEDDYNEVNDALKAKGGSKEKIIYDLLVK